jgi:branched-chain amino acid transport system substrate-binding protein
VPASSPGSEPGAGRVGDPALDRRGFLRLTGLAGLAGLTAACSDGPEASPARPTAKPVRIGYISPQSGSLAAFGEADNYVVDVFRRRFAGGIDLGGRLHPLEIVTKDSQSDPARAAQVAQDLVGGGLVDLVLASSTPETVNPVSAVCEEAGLPCISTGSTWQTWWSGRKGRADRPFTWTWHFFAGVEDEIDVFADLWAQVETNRKVGALWPDDADGEVRADKRTGYPPALEKAGFEVVDPGRYTNLSDDFRPQIRTFMREQAQILTSAPQPPDFATFWNQAAELGYRPRVVTAAKALLSPAFVGAMVPSAEGLSTEVWWSPAYPFTSDLTGQDAARLAADYTERTGKQWTQPLGFVHALFEVAVAALSTAGAADRRTVAGALRTLSVRTIAGQVAWGAGSAANPVPNVARTGLAGGQWRRGTEFRFDLAVAAPGGVQGLAAPGRPLQPIPSA